MAKKTRSIIRYRRAKKSFRRKGFTLPLAVLAGFAPPAMRVYSTTRQFGVQQGIGEFSRIFTGFDVYNPGAGWNVNNMVYGALPVAVGMLVHKVAARLGVNRMLSSAGIPFVRI